MKFHSFTVLPTTPPKLKPLLDIAYNMWFSWNWDARQLFRTLDLDLWHKSHKSPLVMLCNISQEKLEQAAQDEDYVAEVEAVHAAFKRYLSSKTWYEDTYNETREKSKVAYFCCEFGMHESLPIYSGGLGVLAGDHLKSASDLGIPLVAVGLMYRQGYFRQGINEDGLQQEMYPENDWFSMPVHLEKDENDKPIILNMNLGGDDVFFQVWTVHVGRNKLHLLDTNLPMNLPQHRDITKRLYDGDRDTRIRQEILLGMGGIRALKALGYAPEVYHINEGHSAFLTLERLHNLMTEQKLTIKEAKEIIQATSVFTNHTPVPAGNERFDPSLVKKYLYSYVTEVLGVPWSDFMTWGREDPKDDEEDFCLTILALKFSSFANGVSKLHGEVSQDMWKKLYNLVPVPEVPIGYVTNGVHTSTWLSKGMEGLFNKYLTTPYVREIADFTAWKIVNKIPSKELWQSHMRRKEELVDFVRNRLRKQFIRRKGSAKELSKVDDILDPNALTIGFARRFAPYKRGNFLFKDIERLKKIIGNDQRPVQILFAGKAHPADNAGKAIIQKIVNDAAGKEFKNRIIFVEDYDIDIARYLVQGVDVWLNNPIRPLEASGTSGMKAAMNGALNLSVLDGWWDEGFNNKNGWAIGNGEEYEDEDNRDEIESALLYRLLENEVIPMYYDQDEDGLPLQWIEMMKNTIHSCGEGFNAHRMLVDYIEQYYQPAEKLGKELIDSNNKIAKDLAQWREKIEKNWDALSIVEVCTPAKEFFYKGSEVEIEAKLKLGKLQDEDIIVEVVHGVLDSGEHITHQLRERMEYIGKNGDLTSFKTMINCTHGGHYGYAVRILPGHDKIATPFVANMVKWS